MRGILTIADLSAGVLPEDAAELSLWMWLALTVGLFVVLLLVVAIGSRLRRSPRKRSKPSDMTDAWAEAGRKLKLTDVPPDDDDEGPDATG
jgi:hypothetical protein